MSVVFLLYVLAMYWTYWDEGVLYPLLMLPPKVMPPFWHAVFIVLLNDVLVRQATMSVMCLLLVNYKNGRGPNIRKQAQMLTLVEYTSLLYHALLLAPVWYRFFLNKAYGSLFFNNLSGQCSRGPLCHMSREMHAPILLRCKHVFCEDCATEWLERERAFPLCRALVRPADFDSFGDGWTSLFFQFF